MKAYAGIDLHSTNNFLGIIDEADRSTIQKEAAQLLKDNIGSPKTLQEEATLVSS